MPAHTPGPWQAVAMHGERRTIHTIMADGPTQIGALIEGTHADARLIAAAPDMLAALQRFAAHWSQHSDPNTQGIACDAFQAIAKATGGTER